jgi:hypothetical protein
VSVKKDSSVVDAKWIMGIVEDINRGRDALICDAVIKYCNSSEQKLSLTEGFRVNDSTYPRYTERAVRKLIKTFSVEETNLVEDLPDLSKKIKHTRTPDVSLLDLYDIIAQDFTAKPRSCNSKKAQLGDCCCEKHCLLTGEKNSHRAW